MTVPFDGSPRRLFEQSSPLTGGSPASVADPAALRQLVEPLCKRRSRASSRSSPGPATMSAPTSAVGCATALDPARSSRAWALSCSRCRATVPGAAWAALALLGLLWGCAQSSPDEITERERRAVASLAATARMVESNWRSGAVPLHFAEDALLTVSRSLDQKRRALDSDTALPTATRRALLDSIGTLDDRVRRLRDSLRRDTTPRPPRKPQPARDAE